MSTEERVARLEGAYQHLATRADIAELRGEIKAMQYRLAGFYLVLQILVVLVLRGLPSGG